MAKVNLIPPILNPQDIKRFWSKVDKTPTHGPWGTCWLWTGSPRTPKSKMRYGQFAAKGRNYLPHRIAFFLATGKWPEALVCHRCDFPPCVRYEHLFEGTSDDNNKDAARKHRLSAGDAHYSRTNPEKLARGDRNGARLHKERLARGLKNGKYTKPERTPRGERIHGAKLTSTQVLEIRSKHATGKYSYGRLGREYDVYYTTIRRVVNRKTWTHI